MRREKGQNRVLLAGTAAAAFLLLAGMLEASLRGLESCSRRAEAVRPRSRYKRSHRIGKENVDILVLGDPLRARGGVSDRSAFPAVLDRLLNVRRAGARFVVTAAGKPEDSSREVRENLPLSLALTNPDVLILMTGTANRSRPDAYAAEILSEFPDKRGLYREIRVAGLLCRGISRLKGGTPRISGERLRALDPGSLEDPEGSAAAVERMLGEDCRLRLDDGLHARLLAFKNPSLWRKKYPEWFEGDLEAILSICEAHGVRLVLQNHPDADADVGRILAGFAAKNRLPFADNAALFSGKKRRPSRLCCGPEDHRLIAGNLKRTLDKAVLPRPGELRNHRSLTPHHE